MYYGITQNSIWHITMSWLTYYSYYIDCSRLTMVVVMWLFGRCPEGILEWSQTNGISKHWWDSNTPLYRVIWLIVVTGSSLQIEHISHRNNSNRQSYTWPVIRTCQASVGENALHLCSMLPVLLTTVIARTQRVPSLRWRFLYIRVDLSFESI